MLSLKTKMVAGVILNFLITSVEIIGGILSGSLALLSDSIHNLSDAISILSSYVAIRVGEKERNSRYTFGYKRAEIIVAFLNSLVLIVICFYLIFESLKRIENPVEIKADLMLTIALIGFFANVFTTLLLHKHTSESVNVKSAYLHMLSDSISSVGVILAAFLIKFFNANFIDSLITGVISAYIIKESAEILKESGSILMEASPNLDFEEIKREIESIDGVKEAHHFHAWRVSEREIYFECHVKVRDMQISEAQEISNRVREKLKKFGITHANIQIEYYCRDKGVICNC